MIFSTNDRITQLEQELASLKQAMEQAGHVSYAIDAPFVSDAASLAQSMGTKIEQIEVIRNLLDDDSINDILINGHSDIFVERHGKLERSNITFPAESDVLELARRIANMAGRYVNPERPLVDTRLSDGSRVNIIAPPLAVDGTSISIRKFSKRAITLEDMVRQGNLSESVADFLKICGASRLNIVISGGTGSGKTTLLNAISQHIGREERIVTIEDAAELRLQQQHVVRLETKPVSANGRIEEEVHIRDLVRNALRMRPDRIIVGEVRGAEAFDMMQAMNTGHEGSLTTVHANHPRDALSRLENMIGMANLGLPTRSIRAQTSSAINLIIQISRMRDGVRRIQYISEIVGMENDTIVMQDLFQFNATGEDANGILQGKFMWTGIIPRFIRRVMYYKQGDKLAQCLGIKLPKV